MKVDFYNSEDKLDNLLKYVIICTRFKKSQWVYVKHRDRLTWELPAGHIEPGEKPIEAARRELYEETGAIKFSINALFDYSVTNGAEIGYGRVFFAEVEKLDSLPESEIIEIKLSKTLPDNLTYPEIQPLIFEKALNMIQTAEK